MKKKPILEQAKQAMQLALKKGAQDVKIGVSQNRNRQVEWRDGKIERMRESTSYQMGISLYVDGRYSSNGTSDLRTEAVERFIDDSIAMTRVLEADPHRELAKPEYYKDRFQGELELFDESIEQLDHDWRLEKVKKLEERIRSKHDAPVISASAACGDTSGESVLLTSNGMEGSKKGTSISYSAVVSLKDQNQRKPRGWWYTAKRHKADLASVEEVADTAFERGKRALGESPIKSGRYDCILENAVAGKLVANLFACLRGQTIQQGRSVLADKRDAVIAPDMLTIIDDPHIAKGFGSRRYDGEGMSTKKRIIVEHGVLKQFYLGTYYANKLGMTPESATVNNVTFELGDDSLEQLIAGTKRGIVVNGFLGGNANSATGDFSLGVRGLYVEHGKVVRPVAEMNIADNLLSFWQKLTVMGNDPYLNSSVRCPSMLFKDIQFSGT